MRRRPRRPPTRKSARWLRPLPSQRQAFSQLFAAPQPHPSLVNPQNSSPSLKIDHAKPPPPIPSPCRNSESEPTVHPTVTCPLQTPTAETNLHHCSPPPTIGITHSLHMESPEMIVPEEVNPVKRTGHDLPGIGCKRVGFFNRQ